MPKVSKTVLPENETNVISLVRKMKLPALADGLGGVKAKVSALSVQEKAFKDEIKRRGKSDVDGLLYHVNLSEQQKRSINRDKLRLKLIKAKICTLANVDKWINTVMVTSEPFDVVRCTARQNHAIKAG